VKVGDKTARTPRPKASTVLVLIQFLSADRGLTGFDILAAAGRRLSCGTVYPMLRRLEQDGWITGEWVRGLRDRKRPYRLTRLGYREARAIMRQCATMRGGRWVMGKRFPAPTFRRLLPCAMIAHEPRSTSRQA
jgi:hypothetical protein